MIKIKGQTPTTNQPLDLEIEVHGDEVHLDVRPPSGEGYLVRVSRHEFLTQMRSLLLGGSPAAVSPGEVGSLEGQLDDRELAAADSLQASIDAELRRAPQDRQTFERPALSTCVGLMLLTPTFRRLRPRRRSASSSRHDAFP